MKKQTGTTPKESGAAQEIAPDLLIQSPFNPRKTLDDEKLNDLKNSIKDHGLMNRLTVRKMTDARYQIIAGHRRFLAHTSVFPNKPVPCNVIDANEQEARELGIIENIQREDLSPVDEARSYAELMKGSATNTVLAIAAKCGKRTSYITARLALLGLGSEGMKALEDGKLPILAANLLARIPDAKDREKAVGVYVNEIKRGFIVNPSKVKEFIEENFECQLSSAPWPKDKVLDGTDLPWCSTCPNNSSNQEGLPGIPQDDKKVYRCSLASCFKKKALAWSKGIQEKAKKDGIKTFTGKEAEEFLHSSEYVKLDNEWYRDNRTWRQVLKGKEYEVFLAIRPEDGRAFEIVKRDVAEKLGTGESRKSATSEREREDRKKQKHTRAIALAGLEIVAKKTEDLLTASTTSEKTAIRLSGLINFICKRTFDHLGGNMARIIAKRRGLIAKKNDFGWDWSGALEKWYSTATTYQRWGLMMETMAAEGVEYNSSEEIKKTLEFFGMKLSEIKVEENPEKAGNKLAKKARVKAKK